MPIPTINSANNFAQLLEIVNQLSTESNSQNTSIIVADAKLANNETQIANNTTNQSNNKIHVANLIFRTANTELHVANVISRYQNANNILNGVFHSGQFPDGIKAFYSFSYSQNTLPYYTSANTSNTTALSDFAKTLLDDVTAGAARTTLGLGTASQNTASQFATQTNALSSVGGLTPAADRLPYYTGTSSANLAILSSFARTLLDDASASAARSTLGLGTASQNNASQFVSNNVVLSAIKAVSPGANRMIYFSSAATATHTTLSSFARTLLDDTGAAVARATLGLGSASQNTASQFATSTAALSALGSISPGNNQLPYFTGSSTAGTTTLTSFIRGLLDDTTAGAARNTLGVEIGSFGIPADVMAWSEGLAGLSDNLGSIIDDEIIVCAGVTGDGPIFTHTSSPSFVKLDLVGGGTYSLRLNYEGTDPTYLIRGYDNSGGTVESFRVSTADGTVRNLSGTFAVFSDGSIKIVKERYKSQWGDIKSLSSIMVKYQLKTHIKKYGKRKAPIYTGWVAQEVEKISPGLVSKDPETGLLDVKQSIIHNKAVKALGEALERIENLEETVEQLKEFVKNNSAHPAPKRRKNTINKPD